MYSSPRPVFDPQKTHILISNSTFIHNKQTARLSASTSVELFNNDTTDKFRHHCTLF